MLQKKGRLLQQSFSIVKCLQCGHVFVNPRLSDKDLDDLYDAAYYRGEGFDLTVDYARDDSPQRAEAMNDVVITLKEAASKDIRGCSCLDFGCGGGAFLRALSECGCNAAGFDPSSEARAVCLAKGFTVLTAPELEARAGSFDIVVCMEVIEHVTQPVQLVHFLCRMLKHGGILLIATGNWNLVRWIPGQPYIMPEGHIQYFTPPMMRRLLHDAGLAEETKALNRLWFPYRLLPRALRKNLLVTWLLKLVQSLMRAMNSPFAAFPIALKRS